MRLFRSGRDLADGSLLVELHEMKGSPRVAFDHQSEFRYGSFAPDRRASASGQL
jgi:hypothetical protein